MFECLEIAELILPEASVREDGTFQPRIRLRNKTSRELLVPFALGIATEKGGVLGYPSWQFENMDKKAKQVARRHDGSLVRCDRIDAAGYLELDSRSQTAISPELIGLPPGDYRLTLTFRPHGSVGGAGAPTLSAKPLKVTVLPKEAKGGLAEVSGRGSDPRLRLAFVSGIPPTGAATTIGVGELELAGESVKAGAPLSLSFDLKIAKGKEFAVTGDLAAPALNYAWVIHRVVLKNGAKTRVYVTHLTSGVGREEWRELCSKGALAMRSQVETVGMEPGVYDVTVRLWQSGMEAFDARYRVPFKVVK